MSIQKRVLELQRKLALSLDALNHARAYAAANPSSEMAAAIEKTLFLRCAVIERNLSQLPGQGKQSCSA
jgi:hypothetical protein